jgi:anaerobic selenocysteine-containing dehydrogenase
MDTHLTETALLADLVLPAAADLEQWNLFGGYTPEGNPYALLQQPVTRRPPEPAFLRQQGVPQDQLFDGPKTGPLGQARQLGDALLEIAALLNHPARKEFPHADAESYVRHVADTRVALLMAGGAAHLSREGVWVSKDVAYPWADRNRYPTPSGAVEVEGKLVHQVPAEFKRLEGEAFALVVLQYPELGAGYANTRWGREIRHQNPILMNADAAQRLGLREGDRVIVRTPVGEAVARVLPIRGIHPQAVAMAEDFGHWAGGVAATARAEPTGEEEQPLLVSRKDFLSNPLGIARQKTRPGENPWWSHHGPGVSVSALSPFISDEHGAQAWREIRVTIHPV